MKKILAILISLVMIFTLTAASAEEAETAEGAAVLTQADIAAMRTDDEDTHVTIANTTKVSGSFFTDLFGNNTSDIDVRHAIHGYNTVYWSSQLKYITDPQVVTDLTVYTDGTGTVYKFTIAEDLTYNDGTTAITARDYVFSWLLRASKQMSDIGASSPNMDVVGYDDYHAGNTDKFAGIRLIDDYTFSVTIKETLDPAFYELESLACYPYPISVLAPGCDVADSEDGAYITGDLTADVLQETVLGDEGYRSFPKLTCGPYSLTAYNSETGEVDLEINPYYKGNFEGVKPVIDSVTLIPTNDNTLKDQLASGEIDIVDKVVDGKFITGDDALGQVEGVSTQAYPRLGYGFVALSCEQGPQSDMLVRQALMYAFDADAFISEFMPANGVKCYGYYGLGQWMVQAVLGTVRPTDITDDEAAVWDEFNLDNLEHYDYDLDAAEALLVEAGFTLNENGEEYNADNGDTLRYKQTEDGLMPLTFRFGQSEDNPAAELVAQMYAESLEKLGGKLEVTVLPFTDVLADYYSANGERQFDMSFIATNFVATIDPYFAFGGDGTMDRSVNTFGMVDEELLQDALDMHNTEPGDLIGYMRNWIKMEERYNTVLPTLPIYTNVYFDYVAADVQNFYVPSVSGWPEAILYAYVGDAIEGTEDVDFTGSAAAESEETEETVEVAEEAETAGSTEQ